MCNEFIRKECWFIKTLISKSVALSFIRKNSEKISLSPQDPTV